jgi:hypothetical protein
MTETSSAPDRRARVGNLMVASCLRWGVDAKCSHLGDADRVGYGVGGPFLALGSLRHRYPRIA